MPKEKSDDLIVMLELYQETESIRVNNGISVNLEIRLLLTSQTLLLIKVRKV